MATNNRVQTASARTRLQQQDTPEARFALAALAQRESHGGAPTASSEGGRIVFTYPDGTKTCGGRRIN
jgi:hypothetical protein